MPVEIGGYGESHNHFNGTYIYIYIIWFELVQKLIKFHLCFFFFLDVLYNHLIDIREIFLERNEILNNHRMMRNQQSILDNE